VAPGPVIIEQLVSEIAPGRLLLSSSRELERGSRAALFHAPRLFRFDVISEGDALRTVVRNLSRGRLTIDTRHHIEPGTNIVQGDAGIYEPAQATIGFTLRTASERIHVEVTIGTLLLAELGVVRVTAQAVLEQHAEPAA
jgi:hypothetical protein